jgi:hypothetical protein
MPKHRKPVIDDPIFVTLCLVTSMVLGLTIGGNLTFWWR